MSTTAYNLLGGFLFSIVGMGAWRYGKSLERWKPIAIGLALMIYPYFTPWAWLTWAVGIALCVTLYFHHDA